MKALLFMCMLVGAASATRAADSPADLSPAATVTPFPVEGAIGVKYNAKTRRLAFGKKGIADRFDIWISDRDGHDAHQLTNAAWRDDRHQFPIAWHPSGQWLVVVVEKADNTGLGWEATPGYGGHCDYWIVRPDGTDAHLFVQLPFDRDHALTHAAFSPDGTKFVWTERIKAPQVLNPALFAGTYEFNVADFVARPTPHLENIRHIVPRDKPQGGEVECMGPDDRTIYFYSTMDSNSMFATRIYSMNIDTGDIHQLTTEGFAQAPTLTPDHRHVVYMTSAHPDVSGARIDGADWWIMNLDGSHKQRLTGLSVIGSPQSSGGHQLAGSITFLDNHSFYGDVLTKVLGLTGHIVKVDFKPGRVH